MAPGGATAAALKPGRYCLVKGSPEALGQLLAKDTAPSWFDQAHTALAESGLRVLALAYRRLEGDAAAADLAHFVREDMERELQFAGFVAFERKARSDSHLVPGTSQSPTIGLPCSQATRR